MRLKIITETNTLFSNTSAQSAYLVNKEFSIYKKKVRIFKDSQYVL